MIFKSKILNKLITIGIIQRDEETYYHMVGSEYRELLHREGEGYTYWDCEEGGGTWLTYEHHEEDVLKTFLSDRKANDF